MADMIYGKEYISSIPFLDRREILNKVLDITNEETTLLDLLELTGRKELTEQPVFRNFVNTELYGFVTVTAAGGGTAAGAGQDLNIIVIGAPGTVYANVGTDILIPGDPGQRAFVVAKAASSSNTQLTLRPFSNTVTLTVANDAVLSCPSNSNGEGSGSPDARRWGFTSQWNMVSNHKSKGVITGLQKVSTIEVDYNGKPYIMFKAQHDTLKKHMMDVSFDYLVGSRGTLDANGLPHAKDAAGNLVYKGRGLDEYIETAGIKHTVGTGNSSGISGYDLADYKVLTRLMDAERCPSDYFYLAGTEHKIATDDIFKNIPGATTSGIRFDNAFGSNGEKKAIDLGVDSWKIYGRTFHRKELIELQHKNVMTLPGHDWKFRAYLVPTDQVRVDHGNDTVARIRSRYMAGDGLDLRFHEAMLGKLVERPTNDKSVIEWHYESWDALECLGVEHFVKLKATV